jgi:hypothetical protein
MSYDGVLEDRRISAKSIAEQLGNSRERIGSIIHEDLDMGKVINLSLYAGRSQLRDLRSSWRNVKLDKQL